MASAAQAAPAGALRPARLLHAALLLLAVFAQPAAFALFTLTGSGLFLVLGHAVSLALLLAALTQWFARWSAGGAATPDGSTLAFLLLVLWLAGVTWAAQAVHGKPLVDYAQSYRALLLAFLGLSIMLSVPLLLRSRADLRLLDALLRLAGPLIALSVIVNLAGFDFGEVQRPDIGGVRYFGPLGDSVGFVLVFFLTHALLHQQWGIAVLHSFAIVLTGTRGAVAVALFATVVALLQGRPRTPLLSRVVLAAIALGALGVVLVVTGAGATLAARLLSDSPLEVSDRAVAGLAAFSLFERFPWTGVGYFNFRFYVEDVLGFVPLNDDGDFLLSNAMNQTMQLLADGGLPAMLLFLLLMVVAMRRLWRAARALGPTREGLLLKAGWIYVLAMLVANQTAVWLLPDSLPGRLMFLMLGAGAVASANWWSRGGSNP